MVPPNTPLTTEDWQRLLLGEMSEDELQNVFAQLNTDTIIEEIRQTLALPDDKLLTLLRGLTPCTDPALESLTQRLLAKVPPPLAASVLDTTPTQPLASNESQPSTATYCIDAEKSDMPERLEHFQIIRKLGQGGMGAVYLAHDTRLNRDVAIKTLRADMAARPESRQRFLREARAAAALTHDHLLTIYHVGEDHGIPYLAMPVLQGTELKKLLKDKGRLPVADVLRYGRQVALGLAAAHERDMIHRDIKPANIWIEPTDGGRVKILDFGLAQRANDAHLTASSAIVGTPSYMAPEQARAQTIDVRADLFSLGVVLYEMTTGVRPFKGNDTMSALMSLAIDTPEAPTKLAPCIPQGLSDLIMRLLHKHPAHRPATANDVAMQLLELQVQSSMPFVEALPANPANMPISGPTDSHTDPWANVGDTEAMPPVALATPASPRAQSAETRQRPWWALITAALLVLVGGGGVAAYKLVFESKDGMLIVEVDGDADVRFKNGELRIHDADGKLKYTLKAGDRNQKMPAGQYSVHVISADGVNLDTDKFEMSKDGQVVLRVTADPKAIAKKTPDVPAAMDADRKAAEYVLSVGGTVRVNDQETDIKTKEGLPKTAFRLTGILHVNDARITDADLAAYQSCKHLTLLDLYYAINVTDAGVLHFANCKQMRNVNLTKTQITEKGVATFSQCKNLTTIDFNQTPITAPGLQHLRDCKRLEILNLDRTAITAKGLEVFKDHTEFKIISLMMSGLTDEGLAHFKNSKNVERLFLSDSQISDKALEQMAGYPKLDFVGLNNTKVTDAGLLHLKDLPTLKYLGLNDTKITDQGLANLKMHKHLHGISLVNTSITDVGVGHLRDNVGIQGGSRMDGINIGGTQISDDALVALKEIAVRSLDLRNTKITDRGLQQFQGKTLHGLILSKTAISDASIPVLASMTTLEELGVRETKLTAAGVAKLKLALPKCNIDSDVGMSEPKK